VTIPIGDHEAQIAARALDEEEAHRHHLVIALTGAHAYGFPSPDSDLDLKGVHVLPTRQLLGLTTPTTHASRLEAIEGVEIDYASNEVGQVLAGLLRGIGSYLERVLGPWIVRRTAAHDELAALARGSLSRRVHGHYRGFAAGQLREAGASPTPTAKKLLYVLRTGLTGTHLLATGRLVTDLPSLLDEHDFGGARELLEIKRHGERAPLDVATAAHWMSAAGRVLDLLDAARDRSPLPAEAPNGQAMDAWLVELRCAQLEAVRAGEPQQRP